MPWVALATTVLLLLGIFWLLGRLALRTRVQVRGLGFFQLRSITVLSSWCPSSRLPPVWLLDPLCTGVEERWRSFCQTQRFGGRMENCRLVVDRVNRKFSLEIGCIFLFINRLPSLAPTSPRTSRCGLPGFLLRLLVPLARVIFRLARVLMGVRVAKVGIVFTHYADDREAKERIQYWNLLQIRLQDVGLLQGPNLLAVASITGEEFIIHGEDNSVVRVRQVLNVPKLLLARRPLRIPDFCVSAESVSVDVWTTVMLLFTSAFTSMAAAEAEANANANAKAEVETGATVSTGQGAAADWWRIWCPRRLRGSLDVNRLHLAVHYPISTEDAARFEAMLICIEEFRACMALDAEKGMVPSMLVTAKQARMSSLSADRIGPSLQSVIQRLFQQHLEGREDNLLLLDDLIIANCWPVTHPYEYPNHRQQKKWIDQVMIGSPVWKVSNAEGDGVFEAAMSAIRSSDWPMSRQRLATASNPIEHFCLEQLKKTLVVQMKRLAFDVPYEFPLSNFFDHLVFFVKAAQAPITKPSDSQPFNIFNHCWHLRFLAEEASLRIGDDDFEAGLSRCFQMRSQLSRKFDRLDRRFWERCAKEREKMGSDAVRTNMWVAPHLRPLVLASTEPKTLEGHPSFIKPYTKLQAQLFTIYRQLYREAHKGQETPPLFRLHLEDVDLSVNWERDFVASPSTLLNTIDGDSHFGDVDVEEMGMLLGGFSRLSARNVEVTLRDYALPLVYARNFHAMGLLFFTEEPSYPEAKSHNLIAVSPHVGRWSLRGLDSAGRAAVQRTILPIKTYHSLRIALQSPGDEDPVVSGFSPLYEGAFQMLDRAFELFSKPSEDRSPFVPFWDKIRIYLRGDSSSIVVKGPCQLVCMAGTDLHSTNESLSVVFSQGFVLGLSGQDIRWQVPAATVYLGSRTESMLLWLHRTVGSNFDESDREVLAVPASLEGSLPILSFPRVEAVLSLGISGLEGRRPIPHGSLKLCATSNRVRRADLETDFDSYRFFRIHQLSLSLHFFTTRQEGADAARLLFYYYRELEGWFARHLLRFVMPPVKAGRLFSFGTLSKQASPKLSSILTQIKLEIDFCGLFCTRALQYYGTDDFGGLLLRSYGKTKIILAFRMSELRHGNPYSGRWFHHFAEVNFGKVKLGVITRAREETKSELQSSDIPFSYRGLAIYDVVQASRLFYLKVNRACFRDDVESAAVQRRLIESRLRELATEVDEAAERLRRCDPTENVDQFVRAKRRLRVLIDQQELMGRFLGEEDPSKLISYYQFILQNARLTWHQAVRNCVFSLVDQQLQFFRCTKALKRLATLFRSVRRREGMSPPSPPPSSPLDETSSPLPVHSATGARPELDAEEFVEAMLLRAEGPIEAGPEEEEEGGEGEEGLEDMSHPREELMADPNTLTDHGVKVTTCVDFELVNPQIVLIDTDRVERRAAIVIVAQNATLKFGVVRAEDQGPTVGRRTKVVLDQANVFAAFSSDFGPAEWPPVFPAEYLLSTSTESTRFHRLSDRLRATFVYDVSNPRFVYRSKVHSPLRALFGMGDVVRVDAGALALLTTSSQFTVLYDVIVKLLVYRDETQKMRHEQLESIILATNLFQQADLLATVERMQHDLLLKWRAAVAKFSRHMATVERGDVYREDLVEEYRRLKAPWDELALVIDALRAASANKDKLQHRQSRLVLDVRIARIQWTLLFDSGAALCEMTLDGIHDSLISAPDGAQSNLIEIQSIRAENPQPHAFYRTLLAPVSAEVKTMMLAAGSGFRGIGTQGNTIRFFVKTRPPVSGIRIIELLELNVSPLQAQLTFETADQLIKFFFPPLDRPSSPEPTAGGLSSGTDEARPVTTSRLQCGIRATASSFLSRVNEQMDDEDVALMKARAAEYCSFIYINVPASQHLISYKVYCPTVCAALIESSSGTE